MRDFTGVSGASGGNADNDTRWPAEVANAVVGELRNLVTHADGGNEALDPGDNTQVLRAVQRVAENAAASAFVVGGTWKRVGGDGFIEMGGITSIGTSNEGTGLLVFPEEFPTACLGVEFTVRNLTGSLSGSTTIQENSLSKSQVAFVIQSHTSPFGDAHSVRWRAYGY
jgi:hypothetical protein